MGLFQTLGFIINHPLNQKRKLSALNGFLKWQVISKIYRRPMIVPFVGDSKIIVKKGMAGATGNMYCGLMEFEDMGFLLHMLKPGDLFADVGANIGSYTILASAVCKAQSVSFEPIPGTFYHLKNNIAINNLEHLVKLMNNGVGENDGVLKFTNSLDTINHVVLENGLSKDELIEVSIITLDKTFAERKPILMKIDVEGFEMGVLKGGNETLRNNDLKAIIIEINGCCRQYGVTEDEIHSYLQSFDFLPYAYKPLSRTLTKVQTFKTDNTIYIRDYDYVLNRLKNAEKQQVFNVSF